MATIKDVAHASGFSVATISNYLNGTKAVGVETRAKIDSAIHTLGYKRDSMAAWLKMNRAPLVIFAAADSDSSFFSDMENEIENECDNNNLSVIRVKIPTLKKMLAGNEMSAFLWRATGLIILEHSQQNIHISKQVSSKIPTIQLNWDGLDGFKQQGLLDHLSEGTFSAMEYLAKHGHRDIGLVTGPLSSMRGQELLDGAKKYCQFNPSVHIRENWIIETDYSFIGAKTKIEQRINESSRPTAILTFGTQFAFAVMQVAVAQHISVPHDLSVISYIDVRQAEYSSPPLTTISPSHEQMAQHIVGKIIRSSNPAGLDEEKITDLQLILHDRGSVRTL